MQQSKNTKNISSTNYDKKYNSESDKPKSSRRYSNYRRVELSRSEIKEMFYYYSNLKFKLLTTVFNWTIIVLSTVFSVTSVVSLICSLFDSKLHCATVMPSNLVTAWIVFSITVFIIMLGIIFLFTTDGKEISKALKSTNQLLLNDKSFFGKIFNNLRKKQEN